MEYATCHLYFLRIHTRLKARVYTENASNAWHISQYPTRKHCITSIYYNILYYTILYYTILYYTILYYTILYYTILYYTILYYIILYYAMLYYAMLYYAMLYYTILYYTILYCAMPCFDFAFLCYAILWTPFIICPVTVINSNSQWRLCSKIHFLDFHLSVTPT